MSIFNKDKLVEYLYRQYIQHKGNKFKKELQPIFDRTKGLSNNTIIALVLVRNENNRLPFFLQYYRNLGVDHFVFIDNGSADGVADYLNTQQDCSLWNASGSYNSTLSGIFWTNPLAHKVAEGKWLLRLDPDEFIVYPHCDSRSLHDLVEHLEEKKQRSFFTMMVDCYSNKPLDQTIYTSGDNIFTTCPYFDKYGYFFYQPSYVRGGMRMRCFYNDSDETPPYLTKFSLVKLTADVHFIASTHALTPYKLQNVHPNKSLTNTTGCLMHFKFIADIADKITEELERKEHYGAGAEYKRYSMQESTNFYVEGLSHQYDSWRDLANYGLLAVGDWR